MGNSCSAGRPQVEALSSENSGSAGLQSASTHCQVSSTWGDKRLEKKDGTQSVGKFLAGSFLPLLSQKSVIWDLQGTSLDVKFGAAWLVAALWRGQGLVKKIGLLLPLVSESSDRGESNQNVPRERERGSCQLHHYLGHLPYIFSTHHNSEFCSTNCLVKTFLLVFRFPPDLLSVPLRDRHRSSAARLGALAKVFIGRIEASYVTKFD